MFIHLYCIRIAFGDVYALFKLYKPLQCVYVNKYRTCNIRTIPETFLRFVMYVSLCNNTLTAYFYTMLALLGSTYEHSRRFV